MMRARLGVVLSLLVGCGLLKGPAPDPDVRLPTVHAIAETVPVDSSRDAADDPAIWIDRADPRRSLIVASHKRYGVLLYDLGGALLQSVPAGRINNVDLRDGVELGGRRVALVAGSNRGARAVDLWALDPGTRRLAKVADGRLPLDLDDPYGLCMYQSPVSGSLFVFVTDSDGRVQQWKLAARAGGRVGAELTRAFRQGSRSEGCVADDGSATLFVAEERRGVWRLGAEPTAGPERALVDAVAPDGRLVADIEGLAIWVGAAGEGYLVVSSQGEHAYAVYERRRPHRFLGKFAVRDDPDTSLDGTQQTDGVDVVSADLGGAFGRGLLVVQDGFNTRPRENQNFKLVPWAAVERALQLPPTAR
jgi:3-phytase